MNIHENDLQSDRTNNAITQKTKLRRMIIAALLTAIIAVLSTTPIGFVRIPGLPALTILHVPVIVGAILLGPVYGVYLGFLFGLSSVLNATFAPDALSFAFSPFYSAGELQGNWTSLLVAFVPRILVGITPWITYKLLSKIFRNKWAESLNFAISGVIGSLTNTVFVLGFMWVFFGSEISNLLATPISMLLTVLMGIVATNGLPEAILAGLLTASVCVPAKIVMGQNEKI